MNIIKELNKTITTPPSLIQVAINGIWEDTWDLSFKAGMPSIDDIEKYLAKGTQDLAFEVFFKTDDGYDIVLGIRFNEKLKTSTPKDFLITSFKSIWSTNTTTFSGIISDLSEKLTGDTEKLFGIPPTKIELGVINWWKSMGSVEIWNNLQNKTLNKERLTRQLKEAPHLLQNNNNYVAMEFNYNVVPHYWIGIQVADKKGETWVFNQGRLDSLLKTLLDISIL